MPKVAILLLDAKYLIELPQWSGYRIRPALPGLDRAVIIGSIVGLLATLMFAGGEYVGQLWMFWIAPIAGAALDGIIGRVMYELSSMIETVVIDRERSDPSAGNAVV